MALQIALKGGIPSKVLSARLLCELQVSQLMERLLVQCKMQWYELTRTNRSPFLHNGPVSQVLFVAEVTVPGTGSSKLLSTSKPFHLLSKACRTAELEDAWLDHLSDAEPAGLLIYPCTDCSLVSETV